MHARLPAGTKYMKQGSLEQIEALLGCLSVGIVALDSTDLRIRYLNSYLLTQIEQYWKKQEVIGQWVAEFLPENVRENALALLHAAINSGETLEFSELPYEGFIDTRGRTYWHITIKTVHELFDLHETLLILVKDVTERVRSRILLTAINASSSVIGNPYAFPLVLDQILHSVRTLVAATHCAILLVEHSISGNVNGQTVSTTRRATLAAQHGIHVLSQDWRPIINERLLLGRVEQEQRTYIITDTSTDLAIDLPLLDDGGFPRQPGSALSIPLFESFPLDENPGILVTAQTSEANKKTVLGSIEVYHQQAGGFAQEEVILLEHFAQQAGLAIQNARLFYRSRQTAQAERRSAHQRKYIMQALPDGIIIFDARWRIAETNQAIRTLLGWDDSIIGLTMQQALQSSKAILYYDIVHLIDPVSEFERRAHEGIVDEFKMMGADEQPYTIRCTYTPLRDEVGDTFAYIVIYHDVTEQAVVRERIEAEVIERTSELAQRNEELKAMEQAREDFFTTVAHELKTPLANMRAHLSALLTHDRQLSPEEQYSSIVTADEQAERLVSMVNDILDASRVEAGALRLDLEAVLLPELFEDLEERLKALIASSKRYLHISYATPLPAVRADYERIMSVLTNLLSNAFRFAPQGETVLLAAEPILDQQEVYPIGVRLHVSDNGPGITEEQQKLLFTRFSSFVGMNNLESTSPEQSDGEHEYASSSWSSTTGLGLYISRGIVEAHGSKLILKSEPGQGASFSFTLQTYQTLEKSIRERNL